MSKENIAAVLKLQSTETKEIHSTSSAYAGEAFNVKTFIVLESETDLVRKTKDNIAKPVKMESLGIRIKIVNCMMFFPLAP